MSPLGGLSPRDGLLPTHCSASFASDLGRRGTLLRWGGEEAKGKFVYLESDQDGGI